MSLASYKPESVDITSLITLCDGHPRVVGQVTRTGGLTTTIDYAWTNTNPTFIIMASYPTPEPCSISPGECALLYRSWTSRWDSMTRNNLDGNGGLLAPPCTTSATPIPTYSTNAHGVECDNCQVAGSRIRLLFWPVTTVLDSGNLCNETAKTVHATTTGPPRTFVTDGITITSPTVAMSIGSLSRVDKCGTIVPHTIIPVLPEDVTSVEGARALFTHRQFNFADLNYRCLDEPDRVFVTTSDRTDCYREIPASAYFTGLANAAGAHWWDPDAFANSTIYDNYQPQVLPPNTMTEAIRSLWGPDCNIHPNGIWDPPIALQQEDSYPLPQIAPAAPTQYYTPHHNPAYPAEPTWPHGPRPTHPSVPTAEAVHDTSTSATIPTSSAHHRYPKPFEKNTGHGVVITKTITYTLSGSTDTSKPTRSDEEHTVQKVVVTTAVTFAPAESETAQESSSEHEDSAAENADHEALYVTTITRISPGSDNTQDLRPEHSGGHTEPLTMTAVVTATFGHGDHVVWPTEHEQQDAGGGEVPQESDSATGFEDPISAAVRTSGSDDTDYSSTIESDILVPGTVPRSGHIHGSSTIDNGVRTTSLERAPDARKSHSSVSSSQPTASGHSSGREAGQEGNLPSGNTDSEGHLSHAGSRPGSATHQDSGHGPTTNSPTSIGATSVADSALPPTPSSTDNLAPTIGSDIGGSRSDPLSSEASQANIAVEINTTVGLRLSILALVVSVLL